MKARKSPKTKKPSLKLVPASWSRGDTLKHTRFFKVNFLIFITIFAFIGGYAIYRSFAAESAGSFNVFVAPNGSDSGSNCKRFTTPTINPDPSGGTLCATF